MTQLPGTISKMETELTSPVTYRLYVGDNPVNMNELIGKTITIKWLNAIHCMSCGKRTNKSFGQGYCYPCFISVPETEDCVLRPELCRAHEGVARNMEWAKEHCLQDHIVYLALSSEIKVGITRKSQVPTRWIDQGASSAIKLAVTPNRYTAGVIEVEMKKHLADKTNWRAMLTNKIGNFDLIAEKRKIEGFFSDSIREYISTDDTITEIHYPQNAVPVKVNSVDIEKAGTLQGVLTGIKGQYLIIDNTNVINIRKYGGYLIELSY